MKSKRIILTGEIGAGKTTFCSHIVKQARRDGLGVAGLLSPAVFEGRQKTGINAVDLKNNQTRILAYRRTKETSGPKTKRWAFMKETIQWGNQVLAHATPCDLLVLDELGPIEFEQGEGWVQGLTILDEGAFQVAFVVIRPHLMNNALTRWPAASTVKLTPEMQLPDLAERTYRNLSFL